MGGGGGGHWLVRMEWRPAGWSVCLPLLIVLCTIKSRSSLLALAHPGGPRKRKTVVVMVVLVINTKFPPILHRFQDIAFDRSKIAIFGYPSCAYGRVPYIMCDILQKTRCFGLHFCRRKFRYIFNHFYTVCPGSY